MNGACVYCGQVRIVDEKEIIDAKSNDLASEMVKELDISLADYVSTRACNCDKGKQFAYKQTQYEAALDNVEYILEGKAGLFALGKAGVKAIVNQEIKKVSFAYGNTVIKIAKGKEEIKVEKTITTKESLES